MADILQERAQRKMKQRSIAISYELIKEIRNVTKDTISVSGFIRMAVVEKLEKNKGNL